MNIIANLIVNLYLFSDTNISVVYDISAEPTYAIIKTSTLFVEFMLESILEAIDKVGNKDGNLVGSLSENQQKILEQSS